MSELAWRILAIFLDRCEDGRFAHVYLPGWTIRKLLAADCSIDAATILHGHANAQNECERAMRELVDKGLIEQMPNLGERWRLVVKGEEQG